MKILSSVSSGDPHRLGHAKLLLRASRDPEGTAVRHERMGLRPGVSHVICTHLDRDHTGGRPAFPGARAHVHRWEWGPAMRPATFTEKDRYRPPHFAHRPDWVLHERISPDDWFSLDCMRDLPGLVPRFLLVPPPGHPRGHCGVVLQTDGGWLLQCGYAYYSAAEPHADHTLPMALRPFRRVAHMEYAKAMAQLDRLHQALAHARGATRTLASHDPTAYRFPDSA